MSEQPDLLTVPTNRTRLQLWKERHGVTTELFPPSLGDLGPVWFASVYAGDVPLAQKGDTEEDACFVLAEKLRLPWLENVKIEPARCPATVEASKRQQGAIPAQIRAVPSETQSPEVAR
jgi:hypothetical protein